MSKRIPNSKLSSSENSSIVGDVISEVVTVNDKGGSISAILKRGIRGSLSAKRPCFGANLELGQGVSCVLVAAAEGGYQAKVRVHRIANGIVLSLDNEVPERVDPTTKAVLALYEEMMKAGRVKLLAPQEAEARFTKQLANISRLKELAKSKIGTKVRTERMALRLNKKELKVQGAKLKKMGETMA